MSSVSEGHHILDCDWGHSHQLVMPVKHSSAYWRCWRHNLWSLIYRQTSNFWLHLAQVEKPLISQQAEYSRGLIMIDPSMANIPFQTSVDQVHLPKLMQTLVIFLWTQDCGNSTLSSNRDLSSTSEPEFMLVDYVQPIERRTLQLKKQEMVLTLVTSSGQQVVFLNPRAPMQQHYFQWFMRL